MRRMILTSLVLYPVMAHAAAVTPTEPQPSTSAMVQAKPTQPVPGAELAMAAAGSSASVPTAITAHHALVHEIVQTRTTQSFMDAALVQGGTLEYAMMGSVPTETSEAKVTRAVEMQLSTQELAEQPAVTRVVLHAIVDENGVPRNVSVTQSAGSVIDQKAIAAVTKYRFKPATMDNRPTWASVSITIKIQK